MRATIRNTTVRMRPSIQLPEVSVCMPVYDGERFLREAIESVFAQDFQQFELIVTDDRSSDGTCDIVRSFHDPRLRFYQNEIGLGIPGNWNMALSKATGKYIKYLFQDDVIYPDCLSTMVESLRRHESAGVVFSRRDVKEEDGIRATDLYIYLKDLQAPLRGSDELGCFHAGEQLLETCIKHGGLFCNLSRNPLLSCSIPGWLTVSAILITAYAKMLITNIGYVFSWSPMPVSLTSRWGISDCTGVVRARQELVFTRTEIYVGGESSSTR